MTEDIRHALIIAADRYETAGFIPADPIQFPHRYTLKQDIEISALISAWMAYGSRKVFLQILNRMHNQMDAAGGPCRFIASGAYQQCCQELDKCLYRFYRQSDYQALCDRLNALYGRYGSMEDMFDPSASLSVNVHSFCSFFEGINGIPVPDSPSANKRLYMFLRWMVRKNSPVDFGIWTRIPPSALIIPLDTHVYQVAKSLGITSRRNADLKTAVEITRAMAEIWPDDPARGDFALYGQGIDFV